MISFASHPQKLILILPRFPKKHPNSIPRARKQAPCRWQFKALSCSADRLQEDLGPQPLFLHPPRAPVGTALAWSSPVTYWQVLPTTNINPALLIQGLHWYDSPLAAWTMEYVTACEVYVKMSDPTRIKAVCS